MRKRLLKTFLIIGIAISTLTSCTTINKSMKSPNTRLELNKTDFTLSDQVTAEATSTTIIGIDFNRLLMKKTGNIEENSELINFASIPVLGNYLSNKTANYSLYEIMKNNPGYDVVFYPQYETKIEKPFLGLGFLTKITTVKTTARLGKLK